MSQDSIQDQERIKVSVTVAPRRSVRQGKRDFKPGESLETTYADAKHLWMHGFVLPFDVPEGAEEEQDEALPEDDAEPLPVTIEKADGGQKVHVEVKPRPAKRGH